MRDLFFQIIMLIVGAMLGIMSAKEDERKTLFRILAILLIGFSLVWIGIEIGFRIPYIPPRNALLSEQFINPIYNNSINEDMWWIADANNPSIASHTQNYGALESELKSFEGDDSEVFSLESWAIDEIDIMEVQVRYDEAVYGDWASLAFGLSADTGVRINCDFKFHEGNENLNCQLWSTTDQYWKEFPMGNVPLRSDTWYKLRIDVIQEPLKFDVYLDDELIASKMVTEIGRWENDEFNVYISLAADNIKGTATTQIDHILITGR